MIRDEDVWEISVNDILHDLEHPTMSDDDYEKWQNRHIKDADGKLLTPKEAESLVRLFDEYVNSDEFQELLDKDETLNTWFEDNHIFKKIRDKNKVEIVYEPSYANRITVPTDKKYILTTKVLNNETGEIVTFNGVPNARHSVYRVKNEFRTIPIGWA